MPQPDGPGPRDRLRLGARLADGDVDVFGELRDRYGDVVWLGWPISRHLAFHPDVARRVLVDNAHNYTKSRNYEDLKPLMGEGLVTAEGEVWRRQRRRVGRAFHRGAIAGYATRVAHHADRAVASWTGTVDLTDEMEDLTCRIAGDALLGIDTAAVAREVRDHARVASDAFLARVYTSLAPPRWLPTRANRREAAAIAGLERIVADLLEAPDRGQLCALGLMRSWRDPESGDAMTPLQLRDEIITLFLAGHDTISGAMQWFFDLVARHPEVQAEIHDELDAIGDLTPQALSGLTTLHNAWQEALRLFPPVPMLARMPLEDDVIGGFHLPAGGCVIVPIYSLHRDPRFWDDPHGFRPERFARLPQPGTYLPFAAGPRKCLGDDLAMVEGLLIAATVLRQVSLEPVGPPPQPRATITLAPRQHVRLRTRTRRSPRRACRSPQRSVHAGSPSVPR